MNRFISGVMLLNHSDISAFLDDVVTRSTISAHPLTGKRTCASRTIYPCFTHPIGSIVLPRKTRNAGTRCVSRIQPEGSNMGTQVSSVLQHKGREVVTVTPAQTVRSVAKVLAQHRIGAVPVVNEEGRLLGII